MAKPSKKLAETRHTYINALEQASVYENIVPFTGFLAGLVEKQL